MTAFPVAPGPRRVTQPFDPLCQSEKRRFVTRCCQQEADDGERVNHEPIGAQIIKTLGARRNTYVSIFKRHHFLLVLLLPKRCSFPP